MAVLSKPQISPSVLSADFARLGEEIASVTEAGCEILHMDVMDGQYVPNISFGPLVIEAVRQITQLKLESHLMIKDPDKYLEAFIKAGSDIVLVHPLTCPSVQKTLEKIKTLGAQAGLVINPDEDIRSVEPYLEQMDQLLVMSVYPGFGGQKFMPSVLPGIEHFLEKLVEYKVILEIDGGINMQTIPSVANLGVDRFVAGSAVFNRQATPAENFTNLQSQIV